MRHACTLSLTFDHRVTDGVPAARLLDEMARLMSDAVQLEEWSSLDSIREGGIRDVDGTCSQSWKQLPRRRRSTLGDGELALVDSVVALVNGSVGGRPDAGTDRRCRWPRASPCGPRMGLPQYDWVEQTMPEFAQQTGIAVDFESPEQGITDKSGGDRGATAQDFDIFEAPEPLAAQYQALGAMAPLNPFFSNAAADSGRLRRRRHSKWLDRRMHAVRSRPTACRSSARCPCSRTTGTSCSPPAGIAGPPQQWSELHHRRWDLTTDQTSRHLPARLDEHASRLPGPDDDAVLPCRTRRTTKASFWTATGMPRCPVLAAHAFAEDYAKLMTQDAPQGVGSYGFTDCQHDGTCRDSGEMYTVNYGI